MKKYCVKRCYLKALKKLAIASRDPKLRKLEKANLAFNRVLLRAAKNSGYPVDGSNTWDRERFLNLLDKASPTWRGYEVRYIRCPWEGRAA